MAHAAPTNVFATTVRKLYERVCGANRILSSGNQDDTDPSLIIPFEELLEADRKNAQRLYEHEHRMAMSRYWGWDEYADFASENFDIPAR